MLTASSSRRVAHPVPAPDLGAGGAQDPGADRHDQAGLLGQRDELGRRHQPEIGVEPAQQRLDAEHRPVGEADLGLVVDHELAVLERLPQPALQHQPLERRRVHVVGVELVVVAALLLRARQRVVGVLDQRVGVVAVVREQRDADAGAGGQLVRVDLQRRPQRLQHLLRHPRRGLGPVGAEQQQHELVAAEPGHGVALAQGLHEAVGDALDDLVAGLQAQEIVDQLEAVEIDQHHGQQLSRPLRPLDRLRQPVVEQQAVGQPGQRVVVGEAAQRLLGLAPPGQVAHHQHDHLPAALQRHAALDLDRHQLARAAADGQLEWRLAHRGRAQALEQCATWFRP